MKWIGQRSFRSETLTSWQARLLHNIGGGRNSFGVSIDRDKEFSPNLFDPIRPLSRHTIGKDRRIPVHILSGNLIPNWKNKPALLYDLTRKY